MQLIKTDKEYCLQGMTGDDLRSLGALIDSASLVERRHWNHTKDEIKKLL